MGRTTLDQTGQPKEWLNYHHLLYFWTVAGVGSITRACDRLKLSQPTISAQLRALERSLGVDLFRREGRSLVLTDAGRVVYHYADEIFGLGRELVDTLRSGPTGRPLRIAVGIADVVPKWVALQLLQPVISGQSGVRMICRTGKADQLMSELSVHRLDMVLSDRPIGSDVRIRACSHLLGECNIVLLGSIELVERYARGFPRSLDGAPFLIPADQTALRRALEHWFQMESIRPEIRGEFEDNDLMKGFGQAGMGIFPSPAVSSKVIQQQFGVAEIGEIDSIRERYFAVTLQRSSRHPAITTLCERARLGLFGPVDDDGREDGCPGDVLPLGRRVSGRARDHAGG